MSTIPAPGSALPAPGSALPAPGSAVPAPGSAVPAPGPAVPAPGSAVPTSGAMSSLAFPTNGPSSPSRTNTGVYTLRYPHNTHHTSSLSSSLGLCYGESRNP